jgi:hypothetical protein
MSDQSIIEQNYIPPDDGWGDAAAEANERMIKGALLKFNDRRWTKGKEAIPVADGTSLVALATAAMWVRWEDGKPVEYRIRRPGERLPERKELGYDDEREWPNGPGGEPQDVWKNTRLVYLTDDATAEAFTFSTSSGGGRSAVIDLGDQIARMRFTHPEAAPIVELRAADMTTRFGRKSKPWFRVTGWKNASGKSATTPPIDRPKGSIVVTSGKQPAVTAVETAPPLAEYDGPDASDEIINF